ncbi:MULTISPECIES: hypothetical protein [Sphingomonas]|jgi:hypothetical protein|uniref:hypothetical protein n=1 Tax=Sphingomonas TaxID=13687 RepID=UPI0008313E81|nr:MULTISPECIES: hypothetical protein [Sphingomonas]MBN2972902.1 hypothetical protein [Roseomonas aeriglobus]MBY0303232.1 hypothetical protein [Sphingomonas ginsenosidimutans]
MIGKREAPRALAEAMLANVDPASVTISGGGDQFAVTIAGLTIVFGDALPHGFERLAAAIEARIAFERANAMIAAAGETGVPLWLVSGSSVLARWLAWSRTDRALANALDLTDQAGAAPIVGRFARRARRDLGQMSVKIRVSAGQAVAEQIELSHRVRAFAVLGDKATIRLRRQHLPDTIVTALQKSSKSNDRWRAAEIVDHPFFAAHDFMVFEVRNDGDDAVLELETAWEPLRPIPKAAWAALPRGADPAFPWRPTSREITELYRLAARGEQMMQRDR